MLADEEIQVVHPVAAGVVYEDAAVQFIDDGVQFPFLGAVVASRVNCRRAGEWCSHPCSALWPGDDLVELFSLALK